jgi:hypothetical protein
LWDLLASSVQGGGRKIPKFLKVLLIILTGYGAGLAAGLALVSMFSGNAHDLSIEMAMTAAFITGPIGALIGLVWGIFSVRS